MRQFLSSQVVSVVAGAAGTTAEREEELIADVRGDFSPSHWVEQKFQALLRGAAARSRRRSYGSRTV